MDRTTLQHYIAAKGQINVRLPSEAVGSPYQLVQDSRFGIGMACAFDGLHVTIKYESQHDELGERNKHGQRRL